MSIHCFIIDISLYCQFNFIVIVRVNRPNSFSSNIFISIHCNVFTNSQTQRAQTFYYRTSHKRKSLANKFQSSILNKNLYTKNRDIKPTGLYVLKRTKVVAILLELGSITNNIDRKLLLNRKWEYAEAVVKRLKEYFGID